MRQKKNINPKEYWSFFNKLVRKENKIPIKRSELFEHFKNLNDASKCSNIYVNINDNNEELNVSITEDEIRLCINKIECGKSAGLDDVYPDFIKCASDELILIKTTFFNKMLDIGEVPDDWATSIYQPDFKKGEKTNPNNYRVISLASCLCKLFTSVLTERIRVDLEERDVLGIEQAGFRNKMGCADHVFVLSSLMSLYLAQKKKLFVTFIDYEKAFDKVDHGLLWQKLGQAQVTGDVLRIIQNLYQKTNACVRVNGEISDIFDCNIGVRQGDNLSPLQFIIFLNDFNTFMQSGFEGIRLTPDQNSNLRTLLKLYSLLYADDTILLSQTEEDMQRALDATTKDCNENKMTINASKTKYMVC